MGDGRRVKYVITSIHTCVRCSVWIMNECSVREADQSERKMGRNTRIHEKNIELIYFNIGDKIV